MTDAEMKLWLALRDRRLTGFKFVGQEPIGPYTVDFACRDGKLVIEVDGSQHSENRSDRIRDAFLVRRGYRVLRFWNSDVLNSRNSVLESIRHELEKSPG